MWSSPSSLVWVIHKSPSKTLSPCITRTSERVNTPPPPTGRETQREGFITHGEWPRLGSRAALKAARSRIWIIYCTNSHICIFGYFHATGAQWFTPLRRAVPLRAQNRMDIKLVGIRGPLCILRAVQQTEKNYFAVSFWNISDCGEVLFGRRCLTGL